MNVMMRTRITAALLVAVPALLAGQAAPREESLRFSEPTTLATLDLDKLKGELSRLAWSPDGSQLYVQTLEGGFGKPNVKLRHYLLSATDGAKRDLQVEPDWALEYWTAKSGQASPDDESLKIELKSEARRERTTSLPQGGELARGGTTSTITQNDELSILALQTVPVHTMLLHGETIGEFVNSVIVPGLTFGWGPKGSRAIAFAAQKTGRIVVMDDRGRTWEIAGSKDAILPAWSPDGGRLAWLQKDGRKKHLLQVSRIDR